MSSAGRLPTSADVARAAGVSRSTVSYVLNDTPGARTAAATRERVLAAAARIGYVPNRAAADLRRGASRTVLVVQDQSRAASMAGQYLPAISAALHEAGLSMVTMVAPDEVGAQEAYEWAALRPMTVISFGAHLSPEAREVLAAIHCVTIGERDSDVRLAVDQAAVAVAGVHALHQRGRRRLLQVLPQEESLATWAQDRVAAFASAAGPDGLGTMRMALTTDAARDLVGRLARGPAGPDGLLAYNDDYAGILSGALVDAGIAVPDQVALLGSDNAPWGAWMRPALSTLVMEPGPLIDQFVGVLDAIREGSDLPSTLHFGLQPRALHRQTT